MEKILEQIRDFADKAHDGQKRKYTPERYIVHPIRVMLICKEYIDDINILAAALLHDVLEDTPVDKEELKLFLMEIMTPVNSITTLNYVIELTDVYTKEDYPQLNRKNRRAKEAERLEKTSSESQTIKYADIIDNSMEIANYDTDFAPLFLSECKNILERMPKGNADLYQRAIKVVNESIKKVKEKSE